MVTYRLFRQRRLSAEAWQALSSQFRAEWRQSREALRARAREAESGPDYYVVRRHRIGSALLRLVGRSLSDGTLTPTKAAKILGVNPYRANSR